MRMVAQIARHEGIRGFYKGLSASFLGITEGVIQWTLYERLKKLSAATEGRGGALEWAGMLGRPAQPSVSRASLHIRTRLEWVVAQLGHD
jgi:hypothetical protein